MITAQRRTFLLHWRQTVSVTVTNQTELDAAIASKESLIYVEAPDGIWVTIREAAPDSRIVLRESSHAELRESSHAEAKGSSNLHLRDSSSATAGKLVSVHLYSQRAQFEGGVLVDLTELDLSKADQWADYHGVDIEGDRAL